MKLRMTDADICKEYNEAKDKKVQIGILADLNLCKKEDILKVLILNGKDVTVAGPKKPGGKGDMIAKLMYELLDEADEKLMDAEREYKNIVESIKQYGKEKK